MIEQEWNKHRRRKETGKPFEGKGTVAERLYGGLGGENCTNSGI